MRWRCTREQGGGTPPVTSLLSDGSSPHQPHHTDAAGCCSSPSRRLRGLTNVDKSLRLAVLWNRCDVLAELLETRESLAVLAQNGEAAAEAEQAFADDLRGTLQLSLEHEAADVVELLLQHRAQLAQVNLLVLYALPSGGEST